MNVIFDCKKSQTAFIEALDESQVVKNWLLSKLLSYMNNPNMMNLHIGIDPWTKTEKPSFTWAISQQAVDSYGVVKNPTEFKRVINGGLIYRGDNNYSSHT